MSRCCSRPSPASRGGSAARRVNDQRPASSIPNNAARRRPWRPNADGPFDFGPSKARRPAKLGVFYDGAFDPMNQINRDRRGNNDMLPGGKNKDNQFFLIRIDGTDGAPIAAIPIFGEHGTLNDDDNPLASTDSTGASPACRP